MVKGDAEKRTLKKRETFDKLFKVGDLAFSPIYGLVEIRKINKNTASCHQVNPDKTSRSLIGKDRLINIDKSYFKMERV